MVYLHQGRVATSGWGLLRQPVSCSAWPRGSHSRLSGTLWSRLLLAALALLPLAHFWLVVFYLARHHVVSGWLATDWFWDVASQTALAVLGGVAIASGFRAKVNVAS